MGGEGSLIWVPSMVGHGGNSFVGTSGTKGLA